MFFEVETVPTKMGGHGGTMCGVKLSERKPIVFLNNIDADQHFLVSELIAKFFKFVWF